ncbi:MAG TPA: hypothetical protein VJB14_08505, partial [Planctomycetota bacterium]|nr:hypothetical protein [Planctomycetota bacterium]
MKSFTCDEVRAGLSDFLAGEGARHEANLLDVHLAGCAPCRGHAEKLVWQDRVIVELSSRARLEAMAGRVHAGLGSLDQVSVEEDGAVRPRRWIAAAAAAVLLAGAAAAAIVFRSAPDPQIVIVAPKPKEVRPLPEPDVKAPKEPEPAPPLPDPYPKERNVAPEAPKLPAIVKETPLPETPKRPDPNILPPETPRPAPVARDANKPPPKEHVIEIIKPKTVEDALQRGVAFLRARSPRLGFSKGAGRESRPEELVLWTYFMAGLPEGDPEFQRLFKGVLENKLERTYDVALQAMVLEELDRVKYQWRIHQCAQFLVDNQCRNGQWSYGDPSLFVDEIASAPASAASAGGKPRVVEFPAGSSPTTREKPKVKRLIPVVKRREGPESGDNSNSMYAALGLRACHDAGILFPPDVLRQAERGWREAFNGEGW